MADGRAFRVLPDKGDKQSLRKHRWSRERKHSADRRKAQHLGVSGFSRDLTQVEPFALEPQHVVILMLAGGALCAWAGSVLSWM